MSMMNEIERLPVMKDSNRTRRDAKANTDTKTAERITESGNPGNTVESSSNPVNADPSSTMSDLSAAMEKVRDFAKQQMGRELSFSVNEDVGRVVVKIIDTGTNEVIRQIPSEDMLALAKNLEKSSGLLFKGVV